MRPTPLTDHGSTTRASGTVSIPLAGAMTPAHVEARATSNEAVARFDSPATPMLTREPRHPVSVASPTSRRPVVVRLLRLAASRSTEGRIGEPTVEFSQPAPEPFRPVSWATALTTWLPPFCADSVNTGDYC